MILYILSFITIIGVIILLQGYIEDSDELQAFGWIILIFNLIFGWIIIGTCKDNSSIEVKQTPIEVIKGKHVGILVFNSKNFMVKDYDLEKINKNTVYYYKIGYNMYNYITDTTLIIK